MYVYICKCIYLYICTKYKYMYWEYIYILNKGERGEWKSWLNTQHSKNEDHSTQSHHFMAHSWGNNGNGADFVFLGSRITADDDCSLFLGRKAMTNLDSILKSRDITLPMEVHIVKDMVFLVVMYGCESWPIKKAERQKIDAFELWCWRRLLRVLGLQGDPTSQS